MPWQVAILAFEFLCALYEEKLGTEDLWDEREKSLREMLREEDLAEEFAQQASDRLPSYMAPRPGDAYLYAADDLCAVASPATKEERAQEQNPVNMPNRRRLGHHT